MRFVGTCVGICVCFVCKCGLRNLLIMSVCVRVCAVGAYIQNRNLINVNGRPRKKADVSRHPPSSCFRIFIYVIYVVRMDRPVLIQQLMLSRG